MSEPGVAMNPREPSPVTEARRVSLFREPVAVHPSITSRECHGPSFSFCFELFDWAIVNHNGVLATDGSQ